MFMLTLSWWLWIIFFLGVAVVSVAILTGRMCITCFNRQGLPVYNPATRAFDLRMACPSCKDL